MTLTDPKPGFQGHGILEVEYLKNGALLKNTNRKPYTIYRNGAAFSDLE